MAKEFTLERGIAIPPSKYHERPLYPWADMAIGDSFLVEWREHDTNDRAKASLQSSISGSARNSETKIKIATRRLAEGIRVWRVE